MIAALESVARACIHLGRSRELLALVQVEAGVLREQIRDGELSPEDVRRIIRQLDSADEVLAAARLKLVEVLGERQ